jgi:hypothetical protein
MPYVCLCACLSTPQNESLQDEKNAKALKKEFKRRGNIDDQLKAARGVNDEDQQGPSNPNGENGGITSTTSPPGEVNAAPLNGGLPDLIGLAKIITRSMDAAAEVGKRLAAERASGTTAATETNGAQGAAAVGVPVPPAAVPVPSAVHAGLTPTLKVPVPAPSPASLKGTHVLGYTYTWLCDLQRTCLHQPSQGALAIVHVWPCA